MCVCLFEFFSTVQQTRVSWTLSVKNAIFQKFGNGMLYCGADTPEVPVRSFQYSLICEHCRGFEKSWMSPVVITKVRHLGRRILSVPIRKELLNLLVGSRPWLTAIPISQWSPQPGASECRSVRQVVHEDIWYFLIKLRKGQILSQAMKNKTKDGTVKLLNKLKHPPPWTEHALVFLRGEKILPGSDGESTEQPLVCSVPTRCTDSYENQVSSPHHGVLGGHLWWWRHTAIHRPT